MVKFPQIWAERQIPLQGVVLTRPRNILWVMVQVMLQQPVEMETLGGPHAVEQKQTNGFNS